VLERAFASDTTSPRMAVALADAYLAVLDRGGVNPPIGRDAALRRADELVKFALARDARRADAWTTRAITARVRDTLAFEGALAAHGKALSLAPRSAEAIHQLALTYVALGDDAKASTELRRALAAEPERASSLAALAAIELRAQRYREACAYSNAAVAAAPFDAQAYSVRARARIHLGQTRDAYADAETAAKISGEAWTDGLRLLTEVGAGNDDGAYSLGRSLALRYLAPGAALTVRDAAMLAAGWIQIGDTQRSLDALSRARPRGRLLKTALSDPVFDSIRDDSAFKALLAPASARKPESLVKPAQR
jgi:tetratricopeptide (TPR) repeat protein